ncbi:hypothetical protein BMU11_18780 (plasmid) [Acinetobacter pittii]|nr:hypothetical protein BMU11_18780 [Acinetobacter pittii]
MTALSSDICAAVGAEGAASIPNNLYFKIITEKQNIDFNKNVTKYTLFSQSVIKFALYCRFEHIRVNKLEFSIDFKDFRKWSSEI